MSVILNMVCIVAYLGGYMIAFWVSLSFLVLYVISSIVEHYTRERIRRELAEYRGGRHND